MRILLIIFFVFSVIANSALAKETKDYIHPKNIEHSSSSNHLAVTSDDSIIEDIHTLCNRIKARKISTWSQPVYMSAEWQMLTIQADEGKADAFCEMNKLLRKYKDRITCDETFFQDIRSRCGK